MLESDDLRRLRALADQKWGAKRIARELGIARNTVRRYLRGGRAAEVQVRLEARCLDDVERAAAARLLGTTAEGNAVVVHDLLAERGVVASVRTVQRAVEAERRAIRAAQVASVRFETTPGQQMQIDFGEKVVLIAGQRTRVHLLAAVLSHSRRIFVKAFLSERGDDWREGVAAAFRHFGGVTRTVLGDNARALVLEHNRLARTVVFHPAYLAFCRDWDVQPRSCAPYRARTKGKVESGVKYVKRNALAGRSFESFAALEAHLAAWAQAVDDRVHGTTNEKPSERFERAERTALRPLPARPLVVREQRLRRKVANDPLVDVSTVRYSVPHGLVGESVDVQVGETTVRIFHVGVLVATHARSNEPHARVIDPAHWKGLWRTAVPEPRTATLAVEGRGLAAYVEAVEGRAS
jgi:transposase